MSWIRSEPSIENEYGLGNCERFLIGYDQSFPNFVDKIISDNWNVKRFNTGLVANRNLLSVNFESRAYFTEKQITTDSNCVHNSVSL